MKTREKVAKLIRESSTTQTQMARLAGYEPGKMSLFLSGKQEQNHGLVVGVGMILGVSLDWLFDDSASWPPVYLKDKPRSLSAEQKRVIELADHVSSLDPRPEEYRTAIARLLALPVSMAVPTAPTEMVPGRGDEPAGANSPRRTMP